jgi:hypothetical protein
MEQTAIKNALRKMVKKAKEMNCNLVYIISRSDSFGIKFVGKAYNIK